MVSTIDLITMTGNFDTPKACFTPLHQVLICEEQIVFTQLRESWDCPQQDLAMYRPFEKAWDAWAARSGNSNISKDHDSLLAGQVGLKDPTVTLNLNLVSNPDKDADLSW